MYIDSTGMMTVRQIPGFLKSFANSLGNQVTDIAAAPELVYDMLKLALKGELDLKELFGALKDSFINEISDYKYVLDNVAIILPEWSGKYTDTQVNEYGTKLARVSFDVAATLLGAKGVSMLKNLKGFDNLKTLVNKYHEPLECKDAKVALNTAKSDIILLDKNPTINLIYGGTGVALFSSIPNSVINNGKITIDAVRKNPGAFSGKSVDEIATIMRLQGYIVTVQASTKSSSGAQIIIVNNPGAGKNISQVQVSPGGGIHGELPYVKISTYDQGIIKIVDGPKNLYKGYAVENATIIFNE